MRGGVTYVCVCYFRLAVDYFCCVCAAQRSAARQVPRAGGARHVIFGRRSSTRCSFHPSSTIPYYYGIATASLIVGPMPLIPSALNQASSSPPANERAMEASSRSFALATHRRSCTRVPWLLSSRGTAWMSLTCRHASS